jgi:hypothetical protein
MAQWGQPLTAEVLAGRMIELVDHKAAHAIGAWGVTGTDMEPLG